MSKFHIELRRALADKRSLQRNGVSMEALPEGTLLQLLAHASQIDPSALSGETSAAGLDLRSVSPGQWFAVGNERLAQSELRAFEAKLKPHADVVDQSHGRVRIRLEGVMAARVLAKGTAVDLSHAAFPVGNATTTLIGHIAAHVTRVDENAFEITVLRGFAESLWDDLDRMSIEFS
ncbi:sarcosine oxidase subunit gamma [Agrobacterium larrymoorei]|uniref:sarcosine oxidase subunit gamma family protein n=1 Tax=Agrobacterium larrymoorei TaxID=160699 RepID=UPI0015717499|nr:sarcosine oxidase subunit gamma family protein [Agrobacterium larrymoorei]NTJ43815.1 sarcosine oxidase subunit gamma [Agrobacterium larrymoorei]